MLFNVLGPLEVRGQDAELLDVRARKIRVLLSTLLLHANGWVGVDQLVEAIWGSTPPRSAPGNLKTYLWQLRGVLPPAEDGERIMNRSGAYKLAVAERELDVWRFQELAHAGQTALTGGDAETAVTKLVAAGRLWRGAPYDQLPAEVAWSEVARLDELYGVVREQLTDAQVVLGRYRDAIPVLRELTADQPLRESTWSRLILALHQAGRRSDALAVFQQARTTLIGELGVEPGAELRKAHEQVLRDEPAQVKQPVQAETVRPNYLPRDLPDFTGRAIEVADVLDIRRGAATTVVAIDGMAGVGKTALAVHIAHALSGDFPDAQLYVDLHAHSIERKPVTAWAALGSLLRALGVPGDEIPAEEEERSALWRAQLTGRRAVVVLDNVADTAQLRPLLPGSPTCFVLVTSRRRLTGLEGARSLALDVMPVEDAVQLFTRSMARAGEEPEAVEETVKLCGQLPVAIRIAAGRLRHRGTWSVAHLAQRLRGQQRRLAELTVEDHSVSAVFELSYQQLDTAQRRMFRLLGVSPGQAVDAYAAAALTGMDVFDAENLLEDLLDSNLLVQRVTGRYVFHDLVREHAIARATAEESQAELDDAITAVLDYYLTAAAAAADQFQPNRRDPEFDVSTGPAVLPRLVTHEAAIDWLEAERPNLTAAVNLAATTGRTRYAWQLAHAIWGFLYVRGYPDDWLLTVEAAHKAVVAVGDTRGEACIMIDLGLAYHHFGRTGESLDALRRALELNRASGNTATQASALSNLSMIYESVGRYTDALRAEEASFGLFEELGQRFWVGATLNNLAGIHTKLGRWHEAAQEYQRVLALHAESGDQSYEGRALTSLGDVLLHLGEVDQALDHHRRALKLNRAAGDRWGESLTLSNLGVALRATGELVTSLEELRQALDIQEEVGDRGLRAIIRIELGHTLCRMGRLEAAAAEHQRVLDLVRDTQNRYATARALDGLAQVHRAAGRITEARENWLSALEIFTALGVYQAGEVTAELSGLPAAARQAAG